MLSDVGEDEAVIISPKTGKITKAKVKVSAAHHTKAMAAGAREIKGGMLYRHGGKLYLLESMAKPPTSRSCRKASRTCSTTRPTETSRSQLSHGWNSAEQSFVYTRADSGTILTARFFSRAILHADNDRCDRAP